MSFAEDPEVVADLKLRSYTEHDRSRSKEPPTYVRPKFVGAWKCRTPACGALVDIIEETMERWAIFNRQLRAKGEPPIDTSQVVFCAACMELYRASSSDKRRKEVDRMADVIRQLKDRSSIISVEYNGQRHTLEVPEAYKRLEKWGHPDVPGLKQAIETAEVGSKRTKRVGL